MGKGNHLLIWNVIQSAFELRASTMTFSLVSIWVKPIGTHIALNDQFRMRFVKELIDHSYELICNSLPKKFDLN
jgi:hypothetical protein